MFFINLYAFINSLDLTLEKNVKSYSHSLADNLIDELKNYLGAMDSMQKLKEVPEDTLFTLDRYEENYAVCENQSTGEMFDIPRLKVSPYAKDGDILKLENGIYQIHYEENEKQNELINNLIEKNMHLGEN